MTIIAYKDGIIAADRQATWADMACTTTKLYRFKSEVLAFTGNNNRGLCFIDWYKNGAVPSDFPKLENKDDWTRLIVFKSNGRIFQYEEGAYPQQIVESYIAWGSGRDYAMGAMEMGGTAVDAVMAASKYDVFCGQGVDYIKISNPASKKRGAS